MCFVESRPVAPSCRWPWSLPSFVLAFRIGLRARKSLARSEGVPRLFRVRPTVPATRDRIRRAVPDRTSLLEFGPFRLDAAGGWSGRGTRSSRCRRRRRSSSPSLASEAGEVVPKEELLRRVWPDTFVEEANLSVNVSILRKALGEQPDGRAWIQTVARRGYRFLGAVRAQAAGAAQPRRPAVPLAGERRGGRRARPRDGGRAHHAARRDRPRRRATHGHRPPLRVRGRRPRGGGAEARRGRGRRRAAAALGLTAAPHRPAGPDRRRARPSGPTASTRSSRTSSPSRTRWPSAWRRPSWRS